ncbi:MAG TPA: hypothetical protein VJV79_35165 [Polyangiaceae bacterium]|nr:hypothetical protein [Polyangiaceae bacterium]
MNIEVASAMATVLEALPKIFAYREQAAKLPDFDISDLDQLQVRTFALGHAHAKFVAASAPPEALAGLNEQGVKLRDTMYSDAVALSHRGLISGARIAKFRGNAGYKNLALSLLGLATLLRDSWDEIASRSGLQLDELDEAERLGRQLLDAVALREQARALVAELQVQRQRNFTLFSRSYNQVRRVICYLRWNHNDGDQICPSLYAGRGGRRRKVARALATSLGD